MLTLSKLGTIVARFPPCLLRLSSLLLSPLPSNEAHLPIAVGNVVGRDCILLLGRTVEGGSVREEGWLMGKIPPLLGRGDRRGRGGRGGEREGRGGEMERREVMRERGAERTGGRKK